MNRKRWLIVLPVALIMVMFLGLGGFVIWAMDARPAGPAALQAMESSQQVRVSEDGSLHFQPRVGRPQTGLVFYPGGRVEPEAYAVLAHDIAREGYLVVIPRMPLNLAVLDRQAARRVMANYPGVNTWLVGGHSLGGAMAAGYAGSQQSGVQGLILMASFPADSNDLSESGLRVLSIYGTRDGLAMPDEVTGAAHLLPDHTQWVAISGGNHAGFGDYGTQPGDGTAALSQDAQWTQIVDAVVRFLSGFQR